MENWMMDTASGAIGRVIGKYPYTTIGALATTGLSAAVGTTVYVGNKAYKVAKGYIYPTKNTIQKMAPYKGQKTKTQRARERVSKASNKKRKRSASKPRQRVKMQIDKKQDKAISNLQRKVGTNMARKIIRSRNFGTFTSALNQSSFNKIDLFARGDYELPLQTMKYYNEADPANLRTVNVNTGTFQRDYYFKRFYSKIEVRNNYSAPVKVRMYLMKCKQDTSIAVNTRFAQGLADVGGLTETDMNVYPTDSIQMMDAWEIVKSNKKHLEPGRSMTMVAAIKNVKFSPANMDQHLLQYQTQLKSHAFVIRLEGGLAHNQTAGKIGLTDSKLDYQVHNVAEIEYDAGADLTQYQLTNNAIAFVLPGDKAYTNVVPNSRIRTLENIEA